MLATTVGVVVVEVEKEVENRKGGRRLEIHDGLRPP